MALDWRQNEKKWKIYFCFAIQNHGMHDKLFFVHANECQIVQIENSCDKILGLGFDLGHLSMNT
jgi:hypothetical protein